MSSTKDRSYSESTEIYLLTFFDLDDAQALPVIELGFSFANTFNEIGISLPHRVYTRMFHICFLYPSLTAKLEHIMRNCEGLSWVHWGLHEMMKEKTRMELFKRSIKEDNPVWNMILEKIEADIIDGKDCICEDHSKNGRGFLIEALPFYWDIDPNEKSSISMMVKTVTKFLVETDSKTSKELLSLLYVIFPKDVTCEIKDKAWTLKADQFMRVDDRHWEFLPRGNIDAAVKIVLANPIKANNLVAGNPQGQKVLKDMMHHFDGEIGKFRLYA